MRLRCVGLVLVSVVLLAMSAARASAKDSSPNPATTNPEATSPAIANPAIRPSPRTGPNTAWWRKRHEAMNARVKQGGVDLIFVGDSITHYWETAGKDVWRQYYGRRNAVNLGISGDQTGHVLWRLDHGNLDGIAPKLAVVMIGTNNAGHLPHQTPEQIAEGVRAVVERLQTKLPTTKILLLAIFPRGADRNDPIRQINAKANLLIAKLADNRRVFYLDINTKFLRDDGTLGRDVMPDLLHPNARGYQIWAEAIEPTVARLMGETSSVSPHGAAVR